MLALMFVVITWFLKVKFEHNAQEGRPLFNTKKLQLKQKMTKEFYILVLSQQIWKALM